MHRVPGPYPKGGFMRKLIVRMMSGLVLFGFITLLVGRLDNPLSLGSETVSAQTVIQLVPVVTSGLDSPLYVTNARDSSNRLFIVEQSGRILVLPPGATSPLPTPFLDIRSKTLLDRERGLLGMAFHTQYPSNGRFFVNYIRTGDGDTVISEFKVSASNPNIAETTEKILLTIDQPGAEHMGGMVEFGPDGFLYIGMGDGGCCNDPDNRAQNIEELLGKMLRIDVDNTNGTLPYSSPSTNPFFGPIPGRDEIFATGLRNPFRWSFDRTTGQLYAGDVGELDIEEIDIITLGGNYGWRVFEGARCTENDPNLCDPNVFIPPITEYDHSGGRCSVIGGYVYRGTRSSLPVGSYVFGDFCTGEIFILQNDTVSLLLDTDMALASFGEDESGEIYVVDLRGRIFRIAAPSVATTVSAASYSGDSVATESIVSAFGSNFSTTTQSAPSGQELPTTLAGASISVRDAAGTERFAPLFFVSPMQINYQIPPGTVSGNAIITITDTSLFGVASGTANITDIAPGLFTANANGVGVAAAVALRIRADDSQVFEPVAVFDQTQNQFVAIPIDLGLETDQVFLVPFGAGFRFRSSSSAVTATVGGTDVQVTFAGAQGTLIGLDQANIRLPRSLIGRGEVDVVMTVDGQTTNTVRISIK
jgi:uncharacterized protein (TIGR03437 family)